MAHLTNGLLFHTMKEGELWRSNRYVPLFINGSCMGFGLHTPNYSLSTIAMEGHTSTRVLALESDNPSLPMFEKVKLLNS